MLTLGWQSIALICGVVVALAGAIKTLPTFWRFLIALCRIPLTIEKVAQEFSPNGGGSLRDSIDDLHAKFDEHVERDERAFKEISETLKLVREP